MHAERVDGIDHCRKRLYLQQPVQRLLEVHRHGDALAELALEVAHVHGVGGLLQRRHRLAAAMHLPCHELVHCAAQHEAVGVAAAYGILRAVRGECQRGVGGSGRWVSSGRHLP